MLSEKLCAKALLENALSGNALSEKVLSENAVSEKALSENGVIKLNHFTRSLGPRLPHGVFYWGSAALAEGL